MVKVGARIRLSSGKGPDRDGVVTAVTGSILRVRWPSGENTMVVPAPGTLTVLASSGDKASAARASGWRPSGRTRQEGPGQEGRDREGSARAGRHQAHGQRQEDRHQEGHDGRGQEVQGSQASVALVPVWPLPGSSDRSFVGG